MTSSGDRDSVLVPAHRDPEEYLRFIAERDRVPAAPASSAATAPSTPAPSAGSRRRVGMMLGGVLVAAGAAGAIFAFGGGGTSETPEAAQSVGAAPTLVVAPAVKTPAAADALRSTVGERVHIVVTGDTIEGIADEYGVSVEELFAANDLDDADALQVGQRIVLPSDGRE